MSTRLVQAQPESNFSVSINKLVATSTLHDKLQDTCLKDFDWLNFNEKGILDFKKVLELSFTSG